jgi:hypothetical protein
MTPAKRPVLSPRPLLKAALPSTSLPKAALASRRATAAVPMTKVTNAPRERKQRSKWRWAIIAGIVVLVGAGGAYALGFFGHRETIAELREKMRDPNLSDDERDALWQKMRDQRGGRGQRGGGPDFGGDWGGRGRGEADVKKFFAMAPADQARELDKVIDDIKKRQDKQKAADAKKPADNTNANSGGGGGGGPGGGRGGRGGFDPNQANARSNRRLSSTPADSRANRGISRQLRTAYNEALQSRAGQRGVTIPTMGGGR